MADGERFGEDHEHESAGWLVGEIVDDYERNDNLYGGVPQLHLRGADSDARKAEPDLHGV